jgi:hypothetical protein
VISAVEDLKHKWLNPPDSANSGYQQVSIAFGKELEHALFTDDEALRRVRVALTRLLSGEEASTGRDFGRGVAHAARVIQEALDAD